MAFSTGLSYQVFPSHLVDPSVKQTKQWLLDFSNDNHTK